MQDNQNQDQPVNPPENAVAGVGGALGAGSGASMAGGVAENSAASGNETAGQKMNAKNEKTDDAMAQTLQKIREAENVLVAVSNDPSVDEMAAAIGLTLTLDLAGKHATAIYSGKTPNVLEFLNPEETFETNTNSLQDFIIALNKDKADHLRYKIDGDYVKVYITPYKTTISEEDLEFSRGDFNVDLVIGLNVPAVTELDGALREHGRIMHDASAVNITNGAAGRFGDVEWVDPAASSISEMATELALALNKELDAATATAFLTGIVAATEKFSNPATTPEVMTMAAKLMKFGADQQNVIQNISQELKYVDRAQDKEEVTISEDKTELEINHEVEKAPEGADEMAGGATGEGSEAAGVSGGLGMQTAAQSEAVQAAMASALGTAGGGQATTATIAGVEVAGVPGEGGYNGGAIADQILNNMAGGAEGTVVQPEGAEAGATGTAEAQAGEAGTQTVVQPGAAPDYGKMIDDALAEPMPGEGEPQEGMPQEAGMSADEAVALQAIKEAQTATAIPMPANGEMPKIIGTSGFAASDPMMTQTGAGMAQATEEMPAGTAVAVGMPAGAGGMMNPAMMQTPGMAGVSAATDVPAMNFGEMGMNSSAVVQPEGAPTVVNPNEGMNNAMMGQAPMTGGLPMPGDGLTPPPAMPTPDFGAMPPMTPEMPAPATMPAQEAMPQMPPVGGVQAPGAFQIPS